MNSAQSIIESAADELPSPDGVALSIMELWQDDNTGVKELARLVQTDPALSGRLLRLANSAALGYRPVAAVPEAIVRVGMKAVGQLAAAFSLIDNYSEGRCEAFEYQPFWSRSLLMALLARGLAGPTRLASPDDMFACALLSRIGMLALATIYPKEYSDLLQSRPDSLVEAERAAFGFDHNDLTEEMMGHYGVPSALAEPARHHEAPEHAAFPEGSRPKKIAYMMHMAYRLSEAALDRPDGEDPAELAGPAVPGKLGLARSDVEGVFDRGVEEWQEWSKLLDLPSRQGVRFSGLDEDDASDDRPDSTDVRALVVDATPVAERLERKLQQHGVRVAVCSAQQPALETALQGHPRLLLVGSPEGERDVYEFCERIRATDWGGAVYIMQVVDRVADGTLARAYRAGFDMVMKSDVGDDEFNARMVAARRFLDLQSGWFSDRAELRKTANELAISHRKLETLSLTDQLTDLPNRRAAMNDLEQAWQASQREDTPVAAIMIDVDHFKAINDRFGHVAGDSALARIAKTLRESVRAGESIYRLGGEEFLMTSSIAGMKELVVAAERLRRMVAQVEFDVDGETVSTSISLGVAEREARHNSFEDLLKDADEALFEAKSKGRNRICYSLQGRIRAVNTPD